MEKSHSLGDNGCSCFDGWKIPAVCVTHRFITLFMRACCWSLYQDRCTQSTFIIDEFNFNIILPLHGSFLRCFFPSDFLKFCMNLLLISIAAQMCQLFSSLCSFLRTPVTYLCLAKNIAFSNLLSLFLLCQADKQTSYLYKTTEL